MSRRRAKGSPEAKRAALEAKRLRRYESRLPARPAPPTDEPPGSPEKEAVLTARRIKRQRLDAPGDSVCPLHIRLRVRALQLRLAALTTSGDPDNPTADIQEERAAAAMTLRAQENIFDFHHMKRGPDGEKIPKIIPAAFLTKVPTPTPGDRIRQARQKSGLSLRALARLTGMTKRALGNLERRIVAPCLWSLYRVAQALACSLDYLACLERQGDAVIALCG